MDSDTDHDLVTFSQEMDRAGIQNGKIQYQNTEWHTRSTSIKILNKLVISEELD
jgi:hypothetical protein